jgi:mono/diheme cytochrome c family protein
MPPAHRPNGDPPARRAPWPLLVALFLLVSLAVYGIARWQPFEPEAPAVAGGAPPGDAANGEILFADTCAGCHGTGGEGGGVGPRLVGTGLSAADVAAVVAAGRGVMPAGLLQGAEAADVAAYVAAISGGAGAATPSPAAPPEAAGGRATLIGPSLAGVRVDLDAPAPQDWRVWLEGPGGRLEVAAIPAGGRGSRTESVLGGASLLDGYDRVLVGADAEAPALEGTLPPERARDLRLVLDAGAQVAVLREHVRFLAQARDEDYLPNVRFHGEHMVNITRGEPVQDVDGNGDPSNPGDGVGLIDGPLAYLPRVAALAGDDIGEAGDLAALIAARGAECGTAGSVAEAAPAITAIQGADVLLAGEWTRLRDGAADAAAIALEPR